ncbi:MAG: HAMP domain-containing histidine kinase [Lachnospiraceae bacterium]|nr:HAMP domain-containing histidine kinase [Lachnospiraceae bacterium]
MIRRMRHRVILAAMAAFFAVIMMIAALVNVVNYVMVTGRADETLEAILNYENGPMGPPVGPRPFMELPDKELNYMTRFFIVRFDESGEAYSVFTDFIASIDEEQAKEYGKKAYDSGKEHGYLGEYRYVKATKDGATVVAFLNTLRERQNIQALLVMTLGISGVSLVIVFVLVVILSRRAIRPIAKNIEQQKQFITDASHELKTPLTSISTSLDVLEMESGDNEWVSNIKKQTGRLSKLVSELVTLSRLDEERPLPNKEKFSLSTAAWEILDVYKTQAKAAGKDLKAEIEDDVMMVGEKAAIQQMLSVLLDNAIRYSDEKGDIRLSVFKKKNKACIEVFNTCDYDVAPDTERLFDRFYRPDGARSTATGGTGVGLAIAKAVTETHGGRISASCPSGKTMTIKVRI